MPSLDGTPPMGRTERDTDRSARIPGKKWPIAMQFSSDVLPSPLVTMLSPKRNVARRKPRHTTVSYD
jgi:hypothetical protein